MLRPLRIVHLNKNNEDSPALSAQAGEVLHMAHGEKTLLRFYLEQSTGFAPSVCRIEKTTGMKKRNILYARQLLQEDGLILETDKYLYVDWNRVRLFASLDPTITPKQRAKRQIAPVRVRTERTFSKETIVNTAYSMKIGDLSDWLSRLTEDEYESWVQGLKKVLHHNI